MYSINNKRQPLLDDKGAAITLTNAVAAYQYLMRHCYSLQEMWREKVFAVYLNPSQQVLGHALISVGGLDSSIIDVRLILKGALDVGAHGILLAHNHPSGNPLPSKADIERTNQLRIACKSLDFQLIDHVVVGDDCFFSFVDEIRHKANPKEMGISLRDNNPFFVPNLQPMYDAVRDYVRAFQGKRGFLLTEDNQKKTICGYLYDEKLQLHVERQVKGVRVTPEGQLEVVMDEPAKHYTNIALGKLQHECWIDIRNNANVHFVPTLFSLADAISDYTEHA